MDVNIRRLEHEKEDAARKLEATTAEVGYLGAKLEEADVRAKSAEEQAMASEMFVQQLAGEIGKVKQVT
eukprot:jgi/Mesen1/9410/ME000614S08661